MPSYMSIFVYPTATYPSIKDILDPHAEHLVHAPNVFVHVGRVLGRVTAVVAAILDGTAAGEGLLQQLLLVLASRVVGTHVAGQRARIEEETLAKGAMHRVMDERQFAVIDRCKIQRAEISRALVFVLFF